MSFCEPRSCSGICLPKTAWPPTYSPWGKNLQQDSSGNYMVDLKIFLPPPEKPVYSHFVYRPGAFHGSPFLPKRLGAAEIYSP